MANDLTIGGGVANVPAHIAKALAGRESNIMETSIALPSLNFTGKVWTVILGSEKIRMERKDEDGDMQPVASVPVVILDYAKRRGRSYYEGSYDAGNTAPPDCWSLDGITPEDNVPVETKQCGKCADCPQAVKGSRVTDNNTLVSACSENRLLAVIPVAALRNPKMNIPPLRLKLAVTSDYDGRSKDMSDKGLYAFSNYLAFLKQRGIEQTYAIITQLSFDPSQAYPKLFFRAKEWLDEATFKAADEMREHPGVAAILGDNAEMPEGGRVLPPPRAAKADKKPSPEAANGNETKAASTTRKRTPKPPTVVAEAPDDDLDAQIKALQAKKAAQAKVVEPEPAEETDETDEAGDGTSLDLGGDEDGEDGDVTMAVAPQANGSKPPRKPTEAKVAEVSPDVAKMLGEWDA